MGIFTKFLSATGVAAMIAFSAAASAVPFTITGASFTPGAGYGIDSNEAAGSLLDVRFLTSAFVPQSFALTTVNQSFTFDFGTIDLEEANAHSGIKSNERDGLSVFATLSFTAPVGVTQTITANGVATAGSVSDNAVDYVIDWSPATILFGNGGSFQISLADMTFSGQGTQSQLATVTLLSLPDEEVAPAVPVPAATWLFGSGLIGLAGVTRKRKAA